MAKEQRIHLGQNLIGLDGKQQLPNPRPAPAQKPIYLGMPSEDKGSWISDFGDEVLGAVTGYTPKQFEQMRSGDITVDASGEPMYKDGSPAQPKGRPNPLSVGEFGTGMVKVGTKLAPKVLQSYNRAIDLGAERGSTNNVGHMIQEKRQAVADSLFSRNMDKAKGMTGNQSTNDVDYFGGTTKMKPFDFLGLAARRESLRNPEKAKDFSYNIGKAQAGNNPIELAPPKLWGNIEDGKLKITGHEGRHRSDAIAQYLGNDVDIPVDLDIRKGGNEYRRRNWDDEFLDLPIVTEDGKATRKTLRSFLPDNFDTSAIPKAPEKETTLVDDILGQY